MQLGDTIKFTPSAFTNEKAGSMPGRKPIPRQLTGTIVYIHPEGRYFTLQAELNGQTLRESYNF